VLSLLASGYDAEFEPAGGWEMARRDGRTIVLAGKEIVVAEIPAILADKDWAIPVINFVRLSQNYGCPWGTVGWLDWPDAYLEIREAIEAADQALKEK